MSICRVPSAEFSQAPENFLPAHVCPITVRSPCSFGVLRGFSWEQGISRFMGVAPHLVPCLGVNPPDLPKGSAYTLHRDIQHPAGLTFSVPPSQLHGGSGLLTRFPSATRFRLTLGTDSPCADERCAGNLGLSARGPFTPFIATHVSIRTSDTSSSHFQPPSQAYGTLSYHSCNPFNALTSPPSLSIIAIDLNFERTLWAWASLRKREAHASSKRYGAHTLQARVRSMD